MISGFFNTLPTIASSLFTFDVLIALLIGVVGGMVIGALPGLSATMGIALMIPFTYAMEPTAALVMLMTIYTSAIAGGSISAILIHTPGTPSSAATAMDGARNDAQAKNRKEEILGRAKFQCDRSQQRGEKQQCDRADRSANHGTDHSRAESLQTTALKCERVSVHCCCSR